MEDWDFIRLAAKNLARTKSSQELFQMANNVKLPVLHRRAANAALRTLKYGEKALKPLKGAGGLASSRVLGVVGAGTTGWGLGRLLGQTPLLGDPKMTYDQFYQQMFSNLMGGK